MILPGYLRILREKYQGHFVQYILVLTVILFPQIVWPSVSASEFLFSGIILLVLDFFVTIFAVYELKSGK